MYERSVAMPTVFVLFETPVSLLALLIGLGVSMGAYWLYIALKEVI